MYQAFINAGFPVSVEINDALLYKQNRNKCKFVNLRRKYRFSNEISSWLSVAKTLLATYSTGSVGYYLCLFMQA